DDREVAARGTAAPAAGPPASALAHAPGAIGARDDRLEDCVAGVLVVEAVLLDERLAVEAQRLRVGAQEALDERRARQEAPLLILERPQVLGADLRLRLDLRDVDASAHTRVA